MLKQFDFDKSIWREIERQQIIIPRISEKH